MNTATLPHRPLDTLWQGIVQFQAAAGEGLEDDGAPHRHVLAPLVHCRCGDPEGGREERLAAIVGDGVGGTHGADLTMPNSVSQAYLNGRASHSVVMDNNSLNGPAQTMGDRIALLLKAKGLRQTDLAASIGVSDAALSAVVNGQTKNWKMAHLLAASRCLSTSIEYLVEGSPSDPRGYDDEGDDSPEAPLMLVEIHPKDIALLTAYRQLQPDARLAIRNLIQTLSAAQDPRLAQHEQQAHAAALARSGPKD